MNITPGRWLSGLVVPLLLTGCAVGPDYRRPDTGTEIPATWAAPGPATEISGSLMANGPWWQAFGDATLDSLVSTALKRSLDLQAAAARVLQARALSAGAASARWPSLEVGGTASRAKAAFLNFPSFISPYTTSWSASATARYEADLWGRLARGDEAAVSTVMAGKWEQAALGRAVASEVILAYLSAGELTGRLDLARKTAITYATSLQTVQDRFNQGLATSLDLELARQNLATARSQVPALESQLAAVRRQMEILCGAYPAGRIEAASATAFAPADLPAVPGGLPSDILERRPDLQAAEWRLRGTFAEVGQAKAALYPRISLTASTGSTADALADLGKTGTGVWNLVGNLVMPLLNRGAIKSQVAAAEARALESAAAYRQAVLTAFAEVENALDQDANLALQSTQLDEAARAAEAAAALASDRYQRGIDPLPVLLEAQRRAYSTLSQQLTVHRQRLAARVDLIVALGGPWQQAPSVTAGPVPLPATRNPEGVSK